MKDSRLINILEKLSSSERRSFAKFLDSPYFNKRQDLIQLNAWLNQQLQSAKPKLLKQEAWRFVFPKKAFDDTNCRLMMSYLTKLLEQFLVIDSLDSETIFQKKKLKDCFHEKGLTKAYLKTRKQFSETLKKSDLRNAVYYENRYEILLESFHDDAVQQLKESFPLQEFADQLDISFIIKKLRQTCLLLNQKTVVKTEVEIGLLDEIIDYILKKDLVAVPAIGLYYYAYLTLIDRENEQHFEKFKLLILENGDIFSLEELQELHFLAINFCVRFVNSGDESYFAKMLDLYKEGLRTKTLFQSGKLSRFTYHNIVAAAMKTEDFKWAEGFIEEYKPFLDKKYQASSFSYNVARLAYSRGNFDTAISHLQKANYKDSLLNLAAKTLAAKIYFETDEVDVLQSHLEAMKIYIRRKRVMGYHRTNYLNIVRMMQKLASVNFYDKKEKNDFLEELSTVDPLTEKRWLTRQISK